MRAGCNREDIRTVLYSGMEEGKAVENMEVRLQSGRLILVEADRLGEIWKLRGFLTEDEMAQVETAAKVFRENHPEAFPVQ